MSASTPKRLTTLLTLFALGGSVAACSDWPAGSTCPGPPPADGERLPSGVVTKALEPGNDPIREGERFRASLSVCIKRDGHPVRMPAQRMTLMRSASNLPALETLLARLHRGETRRFWIPESFQPRPAVWLEGNIILDVAVPNDPTPPKDPDAPPGTPPDTAQREPSGVAWVELVKGNGADRAAQGTIATLRYRVYSTDGRLVDRYPAEGRRVAVSVVIFSAGAILETMTVGEKRRVWFPQSLSGGFPGTWPRTAVVVDLELAAVARP